MTLFYGLHQIVVRPTFRQIQTLWLTKVGQPGKGEKTLAKVDSAGKVTVLPGTTFLNIKRAYR